MYREKNTLLTDKYVGAKMNSTKGKEVFPHTNYSTVSISDHMSWQECTVYDVNLTWYSSTYNFSTCRC